MSEARKISFLEAEAIKLDGYLHFIFTKRAQNEMGLIEIKKLVNRKVFLVQKNREGFEIYTEKYRILCIVSEEDGLIKVTSVYDKVKYYLRNRIMRTGIPVMPERIYVKIDSKTYGKGVIYDGKEDREKVDEIEAEAVEHNKEFISILEVETSKLNDEEEDPDYKPSAKLERLLKKAEAYANLECDLSEKEAQLYGKISYKRIETLDYDRNDRTAYAFIVNELDEKRLQAFAEGTNVQIEVGDDESDFLRAEVISIFNGNEGEQEPHIDLLFQGQVGIDSFNSTGWITKSFSTVMRDVQLKSIENIRKNTASAKYMDRVFSKDELAGFDDKDLTELEESLRSQKYPPRESQMQAIKKGINTKDVFLVMGPPGTGKTTVILEWVKYFVKKENLRVLVSSQNNKAVDNVLARIGEEKDVDIIRIGSESKVQSDVLPYLFENKITHLQKQIAEKTGGTISTVQNIEMAWTRIVNLSNSAKEKRQALNDANAKLDEGIAELAVLRDRLLNAYKEYQYIYAAARKQEDLVKERYEKLMSYPTSGLKGLWGSFMRWKGKSDMREMVAEYDVLHQKEQDAIDGYNALRKHYKDSSTYLYQMRYVPMCEATSDYNDSYDLLNDKVKSTKLLDHPEWKIELCDLPPRDSADILTYADIIMLKLRKVTTFLGHLRAWQEKNLDTKTHALEHMILDSANLVGATCIGVSSQQRFAELNYDVTIIDEAGQIQVHNALVPMSLSNKLIMLGDHMQIPPSVNDELVQACNENGVSTDLLKRSLFEYMYLDILPDTNKILLDTQFRMPPEVAEIISKRFYDHHYISMPDFKNDVPSQLPALSSGRIVVIDTSNEQGRFEAKDENNGTYNEMEASIVKKLLYQLLMQHDFDIKSVGIIAAYKAQVKRIRSSLMDLMDEQTANDIVATLDSFQGQERDVILYSFTRSSMKDPNTKRIGFLNELRRLNVAITRCKKMIVLIGDMKFLSECNYVDDDEEEQDEMDVTVNSERNFSSFIREMLEGIKNGNEGFRPGEIIEYDEFCRRLDKDNK